MSPLEQLFAAAQRKADEPKISTEGLLARFVEFAERYHASCPFKPGDLVIPRADSHYKGTSLPELVLEVNDAGFPARYESTENPAAGFPTQCAWSRTEPKRSFPMSSIIGRTKRGSRRNERIPSLVNRASSVVARR